MRMLAQLVAGRFGLSDVRAADPPDIAELSLRAPRVRPPDGIAAFCSSDRWDRAEHTLGKSFTDLVRGLRRQYANPPDLVAYPGSDAQVTAVLDWANDSGVAVIPYGGGSSVTGGIEPDVADDYRGAVSLDMRRLGRVLEIDRASRAALIEAGALGPALEDQLRPHGLTLRHFPQSFEVSSLGGWIATRSGGHFATLHTHIDEFVEGLRVVTPRGVVETRRLPRGRRRRLGRSPLHRLGGHPWRDHTRLDAPARPAAVPGLRRGHLRSVRRRLAGGARHSPGGALARQLPAAGPQRGADLRLWRRLAIDPDRDIRVGRPSAGRLDGAGWGDLPGSSRPAAGGGNHPDRRCCFAWGGRRPLAERLRSGWPPSRRLRSPGPA